MRILQSLVLTLGIPPLLGAQTSRAPFRASPEPTWKILGDTTGARPGCSARDAIRVITAWFDSYNAADSAGLDRSTAPRFVFSTGKHWIPHDRHVRVDDTVRVLIAYVRERRAMGETLSLDSVRFFGWRGARLGFMPFYMRSARDLGNRPLPGLGKAEVWCHLGIRVLNLAPVTQQLRAPSNEELKLTALASDAAGSLGSPAALLMVRRSLTPVR